MQFAEKHSVVDVACGYGFSVFAVKDEDDYSLYGTGINMDSQIGFHKHGGETNKPIELLIHPAPVHLPKIRNTEKIQIVKCAAGRAHTIALSDIGTAFMMGKYNFLYNA